MPSSFRSSPFASARSASSRTGSTTRSPIPVARTILFFGSIAPYKGLEYLVAAFQMLAPGCVDYRLIIASRPKKQQARYWSGIARTISRDPGRERIIQKIAYITDEDAEIYFKAADVLVLPYTEIFQSGVLFMAYSFGLPVIASDVGSLRDDIIEGTTGFVCRPRDPVDLARTVEEYFSSGLFTRLNTRRRGLAPVNPPARIDDGLRGRYG